MKKLISLLLTVVMLMSILPMTISAAEVIEQVSTDGWDVKLRGTGVNQVVNATTTEVVVSSAEAYDGNGSMHITYDPANHTDVTSPYMQIMPKNITLETSSVKYKVTFYLKNESEEAADGTATVTFKMLNGTQRALNKYGTADVPDSTKEDAGNGWTKYTQEVTVTQSHVPQIVPTAACDFYVDGLTIQKYDATTETYGADLLNGAGSFTMTTVPEGDDEEEEVVVTTNIPDFTGVAHDTTAWAVNSHGGATGTNMLAEVVSSDAAVGNNSMHLKYDYNTTGYYSFRPLLWTSEKGLATNNGKTYKLTFYYKGLEGGMKFAWYSNSQKSPSGFTTNGTEFLAVTYTDADNGWKKCEVEGVNNNAQGGCIYFSTSSTDIYLDGFTVQLVTTEEGGSKTYGEDILAGGGDFEVTPAKAYQVYGAKIFDATDTTADAVELSALTTNESNKKLTAAAYVKNFTSETPVSAQLLLCVYDGYQLVDIKMSEVAQLSKGAVAKLLACTIDMPEYTEVGDYSVKAYVWDSFEGLAPLTTSTVIDAK